jgi:hypothetical protein
MRRAVMPLSATQTWESFQAGRTPEERAALATAVFAGSWFGLGIDAYSDPLDRGPVKAVLERAQYGPKPGDADPVAFKQRLAEMIEARRDRLMQVRDRERLREKLEELAEGAREAAPHRPGAESGGVSPPAHRNLPPRARL